MISTDVWGRFRERILEGRTEVEMMKAWRKIARLLQTDPDEAFEQLRKMLIDEMDEAAFVTFRNALTLVHGYWQRPGLDHSTDDEALHERYFRLRAETEQLRQPKEQSAPYSVEELDFARQCNEMFNGLALVLQRATPKAASPKVVEDLKAQIELHRAALDKAKPDLRTRRQASEAIATTTYITGTVHVILKQYQSAEESFQSAWEQYEALSDSWAAQTCRQQLAGVSYLRGNVDDSMRANLEVLTAKQDETRGSLVQAAALVRQTTQTMKAGDTFEAKRLLKSAEAALLAAGYPDPGESGLDDALAVWIEAVPPSRQGVEYLGELAQVMQLYAALAGARAVLNGDQKSELQLQNMMQYMDRMGREFMAADYELQQRFARANERPLLVADAASASL